MAEGNNPPESTVAVPFGVSVLSVKDEIEGTAIFNEEDKAKDSSLMFNMQFLVMV